MANDVSVIVHREQVHPTDNPITIRPPALAGIAPKAVLAIASGADTADGVIGNSAHMIVGITDGVSTFSRSYFSLTGGAATSCRHSQDHQLLSLWDDTGTQVLDLTDVALVSGGLNLTPTVRTILPTVTYVFFYGADLNVFCDTVNGFVAGDGAQTITTGLSGNNQIIFGLSGGEGLSAVSGVWGADENGNAERNQGVQFGIANRSGPAGPPAFQCVSATAQRHAAGSGRISTQVRNDTICLSTDTSGLRKQYVVDSINDGNFVLSTPQGSIRMTAAYLVLQTDGLQTDCGIIDSPGTSLARTIGFEPQVVGLFASQTTDVNQAPKTADIEGTTHAIATDAQQASHSLSDEDGVGTIVSRHLQDAKFVHALQDDGTVGWEQAAPSDLSFLADGWQVDNISTSNPTTRKWLTWAIEVGEAGPPTPITGTGALQAQDAAVIGVGEVISPTVITGTGTLQAQDAAIVGVGDVFGIIAGTGALQAQDATVVGVGDVAGAAIGTGTLQAQEAQVAGVGAVVHAGSGTLQAQSAAVIGVGEVGNVRTGAGALQADEAAVIGTGVRVSVGSGTLQAQNAAVTGAGVVEGLTSGTGVLQAQSAAVVGTGHLIRVGSGALQARAAQVTGVGAILGDITLSPADIAAIADAVYAKLVSEGLVQQINEVWQRRGLDPANPQTYDKAGNEIRVGNITIDLSGDPSSVTQTRQP